MYLRPEDGNPRIGNRMALRIAVVGGVAVVLFAVVFFRLWYLQVLSGDKYLAEANNNRTREVRVSAPRGEILDRNGVPLVENRTSLALQVSPRKLSEDPVKRHAELTRLGSLAQMTPRQVRGTMRRELRLDPSAPVTLRRDVGFHLVYYLQENAERFPGVQVQRVFVRRYPQGDLAAHLFGNVGEIDAKELRQARYRGVEPGDEIGKGGVEYSYDRFLRGTAGATRIQVNALGQPTPGGRLVSKQPLPGDDLRLTIDSKLQAAGEAALAARGLPGGFVAMNVHSGEILGLGSYPTFDPSIFTRPISNATYKSLTSDATGAPLFDRAIQGVYPTGSTFKPVTALAALTGGIGFTPNTPITDNGGLRVGGIYLPQRGRSRLRHTVPTRRPPGFR